MGRGVHPPTSIVLISPTRLLLHLSPTYHHQMTIFATLYCRHQRPQPYVVIIQPGLNNVPCENKRGCSRVSCFLRLRHSQPALFSPRDVHYSVILQESLSLPTAFIIVTAIDEEQHLQHHNFLRYLKQRCSVLPSAVKHQSSQKRRIFPENGGLDAGLFFQGTHGRDVSAAPQMLL